MQNMNPFPYGARVAPTAATSALPFLRRVYSLFAGGIAFAIVGALLALYVGSTTVRAGGEVLTLPPLVAFGLDHWIIMAIVFLGAGFGAQAVRQVPGVNVAALFGFTFVAGVFIAPSLFLAQLMATQGATLDPSPVRDAFLLTGAAFSGLTTYVFVTKKDFSFLGAALSMGLWVVLGAMVLAMIFGSAALHLAAASVGVLLFCGYILYDTSRILHGPRIDPVGAALALFLDVLNLFLFLLRILSSSRQR